MVKYIAKNKNYYYFLWNSAECYSRKQLRSFVKCNFTLHCSAEQRGETLYFFFLQITHLALFFDIIKFRNMFWSKNVSFGVSGVLFEAKKYIEFTHAIQYHKKMWTCISQRNVIVSENGILQNLMENISNFCV